MNAAREVGVDVVSSHVGVSLNQLQALHTPPRRV
jgi:hypothetical protein